MTVDALADQLQEGFEIERFEDRAADRVLRDLGDASLTGGGEHDDMRSLFESKVWQSSQELVAVQSRHHEIQQNQIVDRPFPQPIDSGLAVFSEAHRESDPSKDRIEQHSYSEIVVDH